MLAFISLSSLAWGKSRSLGACTRSCARAKRIDPKIMSSRDAQCNTEELSEWNFVRLKISTFILFQIVNDCNEGARKMERMEEICVLQTQIEFKTKVRERRVD